MKVLRIAEREISSYFRLPIAYVVLSAFVVLSAVYTFVLHPFFLINRATLRPFFEFAPFLFTLFVPAITMRAIAEERRSGMLELLQTWPLGDGQLILGKFLGAVGLLCIALCLTISFPLTVSWIGPLDWATVAGGYVGLVLLGGAYGALGLLASTVTQNQIVAFILGFLFCFTFYVIGHAAPMLPSPLSEWAEFVSFERRFSEIATGALDLRNIVYFVSVIIVALGLAAEHLHKRRWA